MIILIIMILEAINETKKCDKSEIYVQTIKNHPFWNNVKIDDKSFILKNVDECNNAHFFMKI